MALMLARRSRVVFRHLNVAESSFATGLVSRPLRAAVSSSRITSSNSGIFGTLLPSIASNSYATAVGKPKAHTGKAKASSKPKKSATTRAAKPAKKTVKAAKPKPKAPGRPAKSIPKEERQALKEKENLRALKQAALKTPRQLPASAFAVVLAGSVREKASSNLSDAAKQASEAYKNLSPEQRQEHEQTAESNKALNQAAYEAWVLSHTPLQIKEANQARTKLRKLAKKEGNASAKQPKIVDPRQVKRPSNAMILYTSEQRATGNFNDMGVADGTKEMYRQYSQLSEHEKEKYNDMAARDSARYFRQYKEVYGIEAPIRKRKAAA